MIKSVSCEATCAAREKAIAERTKRPNKDNRCVIMAGATGLEPAASGVTGRRSNQLSYAPK